MKFLLSILFVVTTFCASAQEFIPLWPTGKMPNSKGLKLTDSITEDYAYRVATPGMYAFFPSKKENKGAAVLIFPGGGYARLALNISGFQLAKWFNTMGISAFVVNYRLPTSPDLKERERGPFQDGQRAIRFVRANAGRWGIKSDKIGVQGSSAGGHLAASLGILNQDLSSIGDSLDRHSFLPNFSILVSPVIDLGTYAHVGSRDNLLGSNSSITARETYSPHLKVSATTPPAFLVHAFNDKAVSVRNSLMFYSALLDKNISAALHAFPQGGHAIALRNNPGSTDSWTVLCEQWLIEMGIIPERL